MDVKNFEEMFASASPEIDTTWARNLINECIDTEGKEITLIRCMEEYAELIQELSKSLRCTENDTQLLEELADAQLCIFFIQNAMGITSDDLMKAMNVKLKHAENRLLLKEELFTS